MREKTNASAVPVSILPQHIGTNAAAQALGMSVGSVQRLMDLGILKGYLTPGGHRKITVESIDSYRRKMGMMSESVVSRRSDRNFITLLSEDERIVDALKSEISADRVTVIRSPVELLLLKHEPRIHFIDYQWLEKYGRDGQDVSQILSLNTAIFWDPTVDSMRPPDDVFYFTIHMNPDFIKGYFFATQRSEGSLGFEISN